MPDFEISIPPAAPIDDQVTALIASGRITADDVLPLRRAVFGDAFVTPEEGERLFALDEAITDKAPEWSAFFLEAITDLVVRQIEPRGYVSDDNAAWLTAMISRDGLVKSLTELELLVRIIEAAATSPESLELFALSQVKAAVLDGDGALAAGGRLEPGVINKEEVELLRRILFAHGGEQGLGVSRAEADILFDLNDASSEADNCNDWSDLFVKAIANHLMAAAGLNMPRREDVLARDGWLEDEQHLDMFTMFDPDLVRDALIDSLRRFKSVMCCKNPVEEAHAERNAERAAAEVLAAPIDEAEARWLIGRINHDGELHDNERALLIFLKEENPDIHPLLAPLLDSVE
ncbi:MAG: hypothetical protein R3D02_00080 [Hyphomicrobiales bacterium]